jgi:hypothetical protein
VNVHDTPHPAESLQGAPTRRSWGLLCLGALLVSVLYPVYRHSDWDHITDSKYALLVSEQLLRHGTFALDDGLRDGRGRTSEPGPLPYQVESGWERQLEVVAKPPGQRHIYLWYPQGSSVLSTPLVALLHGQGLRALDAVGRYDPEGEAALQLRIAGGLVAVTAVLVFLALAELMPAWLAWLLALALGLCTPLWSTSSRALWSCSWALPLTAGLLVHLVRVARNRVHLQPEWVATLCAWMWFCRPTYALQAAAVAGWVAWRHRPMFVRLAAAGAVWLAAFVLWSRQTTGAWLPSYYRHSGLQARTFVDGLLGNLASPSRGLLVYSPLLLLALPLLWRWRRRWQVPELVWLALGISCAHVVFLGAYPTWWGGHAYGARLTVEVLPWLTLACGAALAGWRETGGRPQPLVVAGVAVVALFSGWLHQRGAEDRHAWRWNTRPLDVNDHTERVFDWRYPQFLAGIAPWPLPERLTTLLPGTTVQAGRAEASPWLLEGWADAEGAFRWNEARRARLCWRGEAGAQLLALRVRPNVEYSPSAPGPRLQRVRARLDGAAAGEWRLDRPATLRIPLPPGRESGDHVLELELPDGVGSAELGVGQETRPLALALYDFRLERAP